MEGDEEMSVREFTVNISPALAMNAIEAYIMREEVHWNACRLVCKVGWGARSPCHHFREVLLCVLPAGHHLQ